MLSRLKLILRRSGSVGRTSGSGAGLAIVLALTACSSSLPMRSVEAVATSLTGARDTPQQSPEQLRALQVRDFAVSRDIAFAAVMSTLLDLGYQVQSADLATGFIVAKAPSTGRLRLDIKGLGTANQTPVAAVYVEQRTARTVRVRISLTVETASSTVTSVAGRTIGDAAPYSAFFSSLEFEMAERVAVAEQSAKSEPAPQQVPSRLVDPDVITMPGPVE